MTKDFYLNPNNSEGSTGEFQCAICGGGIKKRALICRKCKNNPDLDLTEDWACALIEHEKNWRNVLRRDKRRNDKGYNISTLSLSDYIVYKDGDEYDGWDVLDGEVSQAKTDDPLTNAMGTTDIYFDVSHLEVLYLEHHVYQWAEDADLTLGELNAILIVIFPPHSEKISSEEYAELLSEKEDKKVSAGAFRRRLSDAKKKLKEIGIIIPK